MTTHIVSEAEIAERERLRALRSYDLIGSEPGESLQGSAALAALICGTPIATVTLIDESCQRALACFGPATMEVPREDSFCAVGITHPELFEIPDTLLDERFATNPQVVAPGGVRFYAGVRLVTPDGHALGMLCVVDSVPRRLTDEQKDAMRALARQVVDHLELRRLARQLQDQAELLRLATDSVVVRDETGRILFWNNGAQDLYGWRAEELIGSHIDEAIRTADDEARAERDRALDEVGSWEGELQQVTKYGRHITVFSRAVVKQDLQGQPRVTLEINTDVTTERRNAEEHRRLMVLLQDQNDRLRRLDGVKDEFIASISHEVRTPLASIRAYLDYLVDGDPGDLTEEQRRSLGVIDRNSQRVLGLVDDLLSAANDAGSMPLELRRVDLREIVEHSIEGMRLIASERGLTVRLQAEGNPHLDGDRDKLAEVVDNLLANAMKFTPPSGTITVHVGGDDVIAFLRVEDDGPGVPADEQDRLFERFYRGELARDGAVPGSGLGLAICKIIVHAHSGAIGMDSVPGEGSSFWIKLPMATQGAALLRE